MGSQDALRSMYRFPGRSTVSCILSSANGVAKTMVASSVPIDRLLEGLSLPDGRSPLDGGAEVKAFGEAVPLPEGAPADAWRRVPIRVTVTLPGYRTLKYDYLLEAPVCPRVMVREEEEAVK